MRVQFGVASAGFPRAVTCRYAVPAGDHGGAAVDLEALTRCTGAAPCGHRQRRVAVGARQRHPGLLGHGEPHDLVALAVVGAARRRGGVRCGLHDREGDGPWALPFDPDRGERLAGHEVHRDHAEVVPGCGLVHRLLHDVAVGVEQRHRERARAVVGDERQVRLGDGPIDGDHGRTGAAGLAGWLDGRHGHRRGRRGCLGRRRRSGGRRCELCGRFGIVATTEEQEAAHREQRDHGDRAEDQRETTAASRTALLLQPHRWDRRAPSARACAAWPGRRWRAPRAAPDRAGTSGRRRPCASPGAGASGSSPAGGIRCRRVRRCLDDDRVLDLTPVARVGGGSRLDRLGLGRRSDPSRREWSRQDAPPLPGRRAHPRCWSAATRRRRHPRG